MSIRLAKSKDKALIISMVNEVYYSSERDFWSEGYFRIADKDFDKYLKNKWLYVLEEDKLLLGCVLFKRSKRYFFFFNVGLSSKSIKKGSWKNISFFCE